MDVIPLTLTASLCLVFTFVVFFLREHSRARFRSAESEAVLPFAEETPRVATKRRATGGCDCHAGARPPCQECLRTSGRT